MNEGKDEGWIKDMDAGKAWITQLKEELLKGESNVLSFIPILLKATINLEKRVAEFEKLEETRDFIKRGG